MEDDAMENGRRDERAQVQTSVWLPPRILHALRRITADEALELGTRPNQSKVVARLIEAEAERRERA